MRKCGRDDRVQITYKKEFENDNLLRFVYISLLISHNKLKNKVLGRKTTLNKGDTQL